MRPDGYGSRSYQAYVLAILTLIYACNFVDRQLLVILQEPIKHDLRLTDTELGLLSGFSFALFYVSCGIPIARLADRTSRRTVIFAAVTVWSVMTTLCGLALSYVQLLLARIGVAVGEAGGSPPAHSMISDIFPPTRRATALSVYSVGVHIGILTAFLLGGRLAAHFGWHTAFLVVGPPGIILAFILRLTVREPTRGAAQPDAAAPRDGGTRPLGETLALLWSRRSFRHIALVAGVQGLLVYGIGNWLASFFLRSFPIKIGELSMWLALAVGLGGACGTLLGGFATDRLGSKDKRWYLWIPLLGVAIALPTLITILTTANLSTALVLSFVFNCAINLYLAPIFAISHGLVDARTRALVSSILFFLSNLIGLGAGPMIIGILSDRFAALGSMNSLRDAMLIIGTVACLWGSVHYLLAAKALNGDLAKAPGQTRWGLVV
jgi:predicted MFS family arabinose efflux permease